MWGIVIYRFIALSWDPRDPARTAAAKKLGQRIRTSPAAWRGVFELPGLWVAHVQSPLGARRAYPLERDAGVILGTLFPKGARADTSTAGIVDDPTVDAEFDAAESTLLVESQGRHLTDRYWGHYVAFLNDARSGRRLVLRDPTGGLPCYMTGTGGVDVFLSDMEDYAGLGLADFSPDWEHLTAFFLYSELNTRRTGVAGVTQLYAGECASIARDGRTTRSFYWNPVDVAEEKIIEDPDEARTLLGARIRHCVAAWTSGYTGVLQELSGGLDSSIVAACAAGAASRTQVVGFHFFTQALRGDERDYARAAARAAEIELIEAECHLSTGSLREQLDPLRVATPSVLGFIPPSEQLRRRLVHERGVGAILTGQGGDHLFQEAGSDIVATEYLHRHGLRLPLLRIVADTSRLAQTSVWSVLATLLGYGVFGRRFNAYAAYDQTPLILSADARGAITRQSYSHPWVEQATRLSAGKQRHVFNVVDCQTFYLRPCTYAELIHPLISQPVVELSLQIPSYVLAHRGRSRGLVREAFADRLPASIAGRQSKGGTTGYFNRMLNADSAFLREFLLDGVLAKQGILDRDVLENELEESALLRGNNVRMLLDAVRAEAWLAAWSGRGGVRSMANT